MKWPESEGAQIICSVAAAIFIAPLVSWVVALIATLIFAAFFPHDGQNGFGGLIVGILVLPIALIGAPFAVLPYLRRRADSN